MEHRYSKPTNSIPSNGSATQQWCSTRRLPPSIRSCSPLPHTTETSKLDQQPSTQSTQMQTSSYQEQQTKCPNQEAVNTKQKTPKKDTLYTLEIATLCTELRLQELETVQHQMANDIQTLLSHFSAKSEQITPSGSASSTPITQPATASFQIREHNMFKANITFEGITWAQGQVFTDLSLTKPNTMCCPLGSDCIYREDEKERDICKTCYECEECSAKRDAQLMLTSLKGTLPSSSDDGQNSGQMQATEVSAK